MWVDSQKGGRKEGRGNEKIGRDGRAKGLSSPLCQFVGSPSIFREGRVEKDCLGSSAGIHSRRNGFSRLAIFSREA